jgi:hypothetical protein
MEAAAAARWAIKACTDAEMIEAFSIESVVAM